MYKYEPLPEGDYMRILKLLPGTETRTKQRGCMKPFLMYGATRMRTRKLNVQKDVIDNIEKATSKPMGIFRFHGNITILRRKPSVKILENYCSAWSAIGVGKEKYGELNES